MVTKQTSFKPGQSGNPKGRPPKGYSITKMAKEMRGANLELRKELINKIFEKALAGDLAAIRLIWKYVDGPPKKTTK